MVMEVEGEGSASKDDPERDGFFTRRGYIVLHASNRLVRDYGPEVAELIAPLINDRVAERLAR